MTNKEKILKNLESVGKHMSTKSFKRIWEWANSLPDEEEDESNSSSL